MEQMSKDDVRSIMALAIVVLIAAGLAFAGSQGGYAVSDIPIYALCIAVAFIIQWVAFIPAWLNRTEKFYDLTGGITYITVTLMAVLLTPAVDARSLLLTGIVIVWAVRLASFLFLRIRAAGEDRRFRQIKQSFARFLLAWTLQGLWIAFSLAAALAAITSTLRLDLDLFAVLGALIWLTGFAIEVIADRQKSAFNAKPENKGKFISTGLWSWSRHPNYFGEIVLWIGVVVIAFPILRGWQWITLISPVFIIVLLTRISGIPLLEARADEKWGGQTDYEAYKAQTSVLIPLPPSDKKP
jgi:steroid 5-alpha reductase family enzyme